MTRFATHLLVFVSLLFPGFSVAAQDKEPPKEPIRSETVKPKGPQLKVEFIFSEYEGEKKIKVLPYTLVVLPGNDIRSSDFSKLRIGDRIPVATGTESGKVQFQFIDVGTSIDCRAFSVGEGRYQLALNLERSWVQGEAPVSDAKPSPSIIKQYELPIIRQFRSESSLNLVDGQKIETTFATDPVSGKVIRLEISMSVIR